MTKQKTQMEVIEEKYGLDFGVDRNLSLKEYLTKIGYESLAEMLEEE